jgi:hypothetical protein
MSKGFPELLPGETKLDKDSGEIIYRQIIGEWFQNGVPSSQAFGYADSDKLMPSYSRSTVVSAQEARDWFNKRPSGSKSLAVFGISISEATYALADAGADGGREITRVVDDSAVDKGDALVAPGHCYVDFRATEKRQKTEIRNRLCQAALRRGETFTTESGASIPLFD